LKLKIIFRENGQQISLQISSELKFSACSYNNTQNLITAEKKEKKIVLYRYVVVGKLHNILLQMYHIGTVVADEHDLQIQKGQARIISLGKNH
jgi:hypothetical protein